MKKFHCLISVQNKLTQFKLNENVLVLEKNHKIQILNKSYSLFFNDISHLHKYNYFNLYFDFEDNFISTFDNLEKMVSEILYIFNINQKPLNFILNISKNDFISFDHLPKIINVLICREMKFYSFQSLKHKHISSSVNNKISHDYKIRNNYVSRFSLNKNVSVKKTKLNLHKINYLKHLECFEKLEKRILIQKVKILSDIDTYHFQIEKLKQIEKILSFQKQILVKLDFYDEHFLKLIQIKNILLIEKSKIESELINIDIDFLNFELIGNENKEKSIYNSKTKILFELKSYKKQISIKSQIKNYNKKNKSIYFVSEKDIYIISDQKISFDTLPMTCKKFTTNIDYFYEEVFPNYVVKLKTQNENLNMKINKRNQFIKNLFLNKLKNWNIYWHIPFYDKSNDLYVQRNAIKFLYNENLLDDERYKNYLVQNLFK
jgi:hypothetical protein